MNTLQPTLPNATEVLIGGIIETLAAQGAPTQDQRDARAREFRSLIATFAPADPLQIMLLGQCLLFNAMLADAGRAVLSRQTDTIKLRAQSNMNGMNRSLHQNLTALARLRKQPVATGNVQRAAEQPRPPATPTVKPPAQTAARAETRSAPPPITPEAMVAEWLNRRQAEQQAKRTPEPAGAG